MTFSLKKFHEDIEFKKGKYYVELPYYEEILENVPSNYQMDLAALQRVENRLDSQDLSSAYNKVLQQ